MTLQRAEQLCGFGDHHSMILLAAGASGQGA
jgi:hypothetical protein